MLIQLQKKHVLVWLHTEYVSLITQNMCKSDYTKHMLVQLYKTYGSPITQNMR